MIDKDRSIEAYLAFLDAYNLTMEAAIELYLKDGTVVLLVVRAGERRPILRLVEEPTPP